tara:strand:- start:897 stop:1136 length:240 start_codon:yes stop_codon:yes gene_type:complete
MECKYNVDDIDKIVGYKSWTPRQKVDALLFIDCTLYTNLGKESSQTERLITKAKSKKLYKAIAKVDSKVGTLILKALDE